jgi:hypothetical protein
MSKATRISLSTPSMPWYLCELGCGLINHRCSSRELFCAVTLLFYDGRSWAPGRQRRPRDPASAEPRQPSHGGDRNSKVNSAPDRRAVLRLRRPPRGGTNPAMRRSSSSTRITRCPIESARRGCRPAILGCCRSAGGTPRSGSRDRAVRERLRQERGRRFRLTPPCANSRSR